MALIFASIVKCSHNQSPVNNKYTQRCIINTIVFYFYRPISNNTQIYPQEKIVCSRYPFPYTCTYGFIIYLSSYVLITNLDYVLFIVNLFEVECYIIFCSALLKITLQGICSHIISYHIT